MYEWMYCVYVCLYVCLYVCMHACMHVCMYADCMHVCMYACMYFLSLQILIVCVFAHVRFTRLRGCIWSTHMDGIIVGTSGFSSRCRPRSNGLVEGTGEAEIYMPRAYTPEAIRCRNLRQVLPSKALSKLGLRWGYKMAVPKQTDLQKRIVSLPAFQFPLHGPCNKNQWIYMQPGPCQNGSIPSTMSWSFRMFCRKPKRASLGHRTSKPLVHLQLTTPSFKPFGRSADGAASKALVVWIRRVLHKTDVTPQNQQVSSLSAIWTTHGPHGSHRSCSFMFTK